MVMIRLARVGAPKQPYYRIVVIEKDRARNGRSIEVVGTYNPRTNPATVNLKHDRIAYWRSVGATLSPIMQKLVAKNPAVPDTPAPVVTDPTPRQFLTRPQPESSTLCCCRRPRRPGQHISLCFKRYACYYSRTVSECQSSKVDGQRQDHDPS